MLDLLNNLLELCLEAAPWLLLGMIIGGLLKAWIPTTFMERHLGGQGILPIIKAAILGAPLPLCSCGVIPAALGLRKAGASKRATISFLVSTPETGVDSVAITYALLGPFMAVVRPIAAIFSALAAGLLAGRSEAPAMPIHDIPVKVTSCCSSTESEESCCGSEDGESTAEGFMARSLDGLRYSFGQLLDDMLLWLIVGLLFAAIIKTFVPATFMAQWGSGLPAMLLMTVIGIPMYVCATASTPIAAGLMLAGVSPGVALVFLMAGPATNISTLGIITRELGKQAITGYLIGVISIALLSGLAVDYLVDYWRIDIQAQLSSGLEFMPPWIAWTSLIIILAAALKPFALHRQCSPRS